MSRTELRMALRTLPFLDAHAGSREGWLELSRDPAPKLLVWHPDAIEWIFRSDSALGHPGSRSLMPLFGTHSLLWADGPRHAAYRRVVGSPLRGRGLAGYRGVVARAVHDAVGALRPGQIVRLPDWTRRIALRVVGRIVLGDSDDGVLDEFTAWIDRALGSRHRTLAYRFLRGGLPRSGARLDERLITAARNGAGTRPPTIAELMLSGAGPLGGVSDEELRDQIVSLLFAGHETTASAAAWTLYWLERDQRLRQDVTDELAGVPDDVPEATRVPLLQAVIQEALRLAPPVTVAENRRLPEEAEVLGRRLPAGSTLTTSIYLAHRRAEYFPEPLRFDPYRFLDARIPAQHYLPFGGGSRHCPGSRLGQLEIRAIASAVLRRREWRCVNPRAGVPQLRGHAMAPASRLRMKVTACLD